jgi:hypothetical protein
MLDRPAGVPMYRFEDLQPGQVATRDQAQQ